MNVNENEKQNKT